MHLHHLLTDSQLGCALFAPPFVTLAVVFALGILAQPEQRLARVVKADAGKIAARLPEGM